MIFRADTTQPRLKELFDFNPELGTWIRLVKRGGQMGAFTPVTRANGYTLIRVDGVQYLAHRLAWLYVYGEWPKHQIDHINGIGSDNRIANLRDVTCTVNQQNQRKARKDNSSGFLGVSKHAGKYQASIMLVSGQKFLGTFQTALHAHTAYVAAKRLHHEGCTI